jgi:hypothetical protein
MRPALRKAALVVTQPSALCGAFLGAAIAAVEPGGTGLHGLIPGWLYGIVVGGLQRSFRVPAGAYPLVGLVCGPLPFALLMPVGAAEDARGLIWVGMLAGLVLGCVEWAHARHRARTVGGATGPGSSAD